MIILDIKELQIPEIKVLRYKKIIDNRGYFSETFRLSDIKNSENCQFLHNEEFNQFNESYSKANTFRGLHFQYNPFMGKLVRCIEGRLYDFALDIRKNSPNFGKIIVYELQNSTEYNEWIWLPAGFAHGMYLPIDTRIEYLCTGYWNGPTEFSISLYDENIDWTLNSDEILKIINNIKQDSNLLITEKDRNGYRLVDWLKTEHSNKFEYGK